MRAYASVYTADAVVLELERAGRPLTVKYKLIL